jgi:hypothetical protein
MRIISFSDRPGPSLRSVYFAGALAMLCAAGCGGETGIVLEVTRADSVPAEIDRLRFFVGVQGDAARPAIDDRDPESEVAFAAARDLLADPYRLLLRPGAEAGDMSMQVAVVAFAGGQVVGFGALQDQVGFVDGKLLRWEILLTSDPETRVDITDTGCLRWTSDADTIVIAPPNDKDCDNDDASVDCDDLDPKVGPSKQERCDNQIDDDCDGIVDEVQDLDGDGFNNCDDCDDNNDTVYPGAPEICDGLDNDCNGVCDDGPLDADGDGYNICGSKIFDDGTCSDPHPDTVDCNDEDDQIYPGAEEICDGKDNDCDGTCDAEFDADGDDYTTCGSKVSSCNGETKADYVDCDDEDDRVHPHAEERCDGVDNNCDGIFYPETVACYVVNDADNTCVVGVRQCNDANGAGWAGECQASNDEAAPDNLCEAYDACDQAGAADPFECANMGATTSNIDCSLLVGPAGLCPSRVVALPNTSSGQCTWTILGGGQQQHYLVSLRSLSTSTNTGPLLAECQAGFAVLSATTTPPTTDSVYLWQTVDANDAQLLGLHLYPESVAECPQQGLQCQGLTPVTPN